MLFFEVLLKGLVIFLLQEGHLKQIAIIFQLIRSFDLAIHLFGTST